MVKDHSDSESGNPELLLPISSKDYFICTIHRLENSYHDVFYTSLAGMK